MIEWTDSEVKLKRHTAYRKQSGRTRSTEWKWAWKINRRMKESREWRQSDSGDEAAGWRQTEPNKKNERQQRRQPHTADVFVWTPANSRTNKRIPVMKSKILFIRDFFSASNMECFSVALLFPPSQRCCWCRPCYCGLCCWIQHNVFIASLDLSMVFSFLTWELTCLHEI